MKKGSLLTLTILASCGALTGEEVGRLPINQISTKDNFITKETSVDLKARDEIVFWSEMDMEYEGDVALRFRITIQKDGKPYDNLEIDPTMKDLTIGEVRASSNNRTSWSYSGQNAVFNVQEDGKYLFRGILIASENSTLVIRKAEMVLKKL